MYAYLLSLLRTFGLWLVGELLTPAIVQELETVLFDELKKAAKRTATSTDDWVLERVQLIVDPKTLAEGVAAFLRERVKAGDPPVAKPAE